MAMRGVIRRAVVAVMAVVGLFGMPAAAASAASAPAALSFQPAAHDYGQVSVGETSQHQLRLVNTGGRASSALTVTVSGSPAFTVTADTCTGASLGPGKSCTVTLRYTPAAVGAAKATLTVVSRNRAASATAQLTGTGRRLGSPAPFSHLYWTSYDGAFYHVQAGPLAGGTVTTVTALLQTANYLAVDDTYIYWSDSQDRSIRRVSLAGGPSTTVASGLGNPQGVAVDGTHVYWADHQTGTINAVPLTGGSVTTLVTGQSSPNGLAVDASHLYWSTGAGTINQAPLVGGSATTLVAGQSGPSGVAVDANNIYWADNNGQLGNNGTISSAPLGVVPAAATILASGQNLPLGVVVHGAQLYWANGGAGTINTVPVTGGAASTRFSGLDPPKGLAVGP
jgi:HYDIN/CFA65/VesB family protein/low-density lipoprotein receptor class B